jgi:hypothetical protein
MKLNCWVFYGIIVVNVVRAEEVSLLLLLNLWNIVFDLDFYLISFFLYLLGLFNEELLLYFVRSHVPTSAQYFVTNRKYKKKVKNTYYNATGSYWILTLSPL